MPINEKSYDEMYPGRFLRAVDLKGQTVTVQISDINAEELEADKEKGKPLVKKREYILSFAGKKKALVLNKTNGFAIAQMFGLNPNTWPGKRVTLYPTTCRFGPKMVDCIRVYGSPDIPEQKEVAGKIGRSMFKATLHAVRSTKSEPAPRPETESQPEVSQDVLDAWAALGWSPEQGHRHMEEHGAGDYGGHLNSLIDEMNATEETF